MTKSEELIILQKRIPEQEAYIKSLIMEVGEITSSFYDGVMEARLKRIDEELMPSAVGVLKNLKERAEDLHRQYY